MNQIPSEGASYIVKTIFEYAGPSVAAGLNVEGARFGSSSDSTTATQGTAMQIVATSIDACCSLVMEATKNFAGKEPHLVRPNATYVAGYVARRLVGFGQLSPSTGAVFLAACGAVVLDVGLLVAFPPAGIGIAFCALGLAIDGWCVGTAWANYRSPSSPVPSSSGGLLQSPRLRSSGKAIQLINQLQRELPRQQFYNFKPLSVPYNIWY